MSTRLSLSLVLALAGGLSGCASPAQAPQQERAEARPTVRVGDAWPAAEEWLLAAGAQPTQLAAMGDAHFELPDGRALIVVLSEGRVSELELVEGLERPKHERSSKRVEELRL